MNAPISLHNLLPVSGIQQGTDVIHESAHLHVTGSATFTDDMPELAGTLYAALIMSPVAHGELIGDGIDRDAILKEHGVVAVYTAKDIPGENNCGPIVHDDPFLAVGKVEFLGQAVPPSPMTCLSWPALCMRPSLCRPLPMANLLATALTATLF